MAQQKPITTKRQLNNRVDFYFEDLSTGTDMPHLDGFSLFIEKTRAEVELLFNQFPKSRDYFASRSIKRVWELAAIKVGDKGTVALYNPKLIEFFLKNNHKDIYKADNGWIKETVNENGETIHVEFVNTSKNKLK